MKRLYVGCRVRVVNARVSKFLIGREAVLVGFVRGIEDDGSSYYGWDTGLTNWCGASFIAHDYELEPIIPEGHQIVSWEAMKGLWTPEGIPA